MEIVNLCAHPISYHEGRRKRVIAPSGTVARVITEEIQHWHEGGFLLTRSRVVEIENLPPPRPGVTYIVSAWVARECPDRHDLWVPAKRVRRGQDGVIGCRAFEVS